GARFSEALGNAIGALKEQGCDRLIVDLRGNIGGGLGFARLASYLCPGQIPIGHSLTPGCLRRGYACPERSEGTERNSRGSRCRARGRRWRSRWSAWSLWLGSAKWCAGGGCGWTPRWWRRTFIIPLTALCSRTECE